MYQALYRKWRPKTFDQVVGQAHITETLKNQISSGRLSHAYLFIGTRGTGKTTCAKILAKAVNCQHPVNGNPCGECPACLGIEEGSIMDVVEIDAASNNGVDNVRQLRDEAVFSPVSVNKRVYIIDEVHMLSTAAFNALLKILEEPPEHLLFILATTELNKVPATILSRCQRHSFKRLDPAVISEQLDRIAAAEGFDLQPDASRLIAGLAEGGMRDALSLLDQCSGCEHIDVDAVYSVMGLTGSRRTAELMNLTLKRDTEAALEMFNRLWTDGKDPASFLNELNMLQRDCLMLSVAPRTGEKLISGTYTLNILNVFLRKLTKAELIARIDTVNGYLARMRDTKSPKMIAELCIIALCDPTLCDSIESMRGRLARLEDDMKNAPRSMPAAVCKPELMSEEQPVFDELEPDSEREDEPPPRVSEPSEESESEDINALNPDAPENLAPPTDNAEFWRAMLEKLHDKLPMGFDSFFADPTQAIGNLEGDTLHLFFEPSFTYGMLNKESILLRVREAAVELTGRSLKLRVSELKPEDSAPPGNLDELKRFKETRFI